MCTCASCEYTDSFTGFKWDDAGEKQLPNVRDGRGGFDTWPKGEPAGERSSDAAYAAHWRHCSVMRDAKPYQSPSAATVYGIPAGMTREQVEATLRRSFGLDAPDPATLPGPRETLTVAQRWIARSYQWVKEASPVLPEPARPAQPGKAAQHLPAENRPSEPRAILYVMAKGKSPYMTVPEAARALDCSESRVLQWIHEERIPGAFKPARDWLIPSNAKRPDELPRGRPKASASR